jgi:MerR family copper efflux transcriptional regulator
MSEPIACSLSGAGQQARRDEAAALMARSLLARESIDGGVRLRFRRDAEPELRELVRRESECCPFFGFAFASPGSELVLEATAPPEARGLLDELFAAP